MVDPLTATNRLGGIATRQQLVAAGCSGYDLTRAVRRGVLRRLRQARYASSIALPDAMVAARVGGMLAGPSAARTFGLWSGFDTRVHISVGQNSSRLRTNFPPSFKPTSLSSDIVARRVCLHWLKDGATPELGPECWRVPLEVCLRQVVQWCDRETAIACLDTALSVRKIPRSVLEKIFARSPIADRLLLGQCSVGSQAGTESIVRQRLHALGVAVRQQVWVPGVGHVDFGVVGTRVVIEVDGRQYHEDPIQFEEDRRRDAELVSRNFTVVRLSYLQVTTDWAWCERMILAAIRFA